MRVSSGLCLSIKDSRMPPLPNETDILCLIYAPAVAFFRAVSLIMRNLRTPGWVDFGWGYTNQTAEGERE